MRMDAARYSDGMPTLVLTLVGDDRAGLVASVAEVVESHGGNWENSRLAELAGAFAGIVEVSVSADRAEALRSALAGIDGLHTVTVPAAGARPQATARRILLGVLGNDRSGIVRDVTAALGARGVSIERMSTETRDAAMSGGRLFEAAISATVPPGVDLDDVRTALETLAGEIQVEVTPAD